jgi:hypothetical protein
MHNKNQNYQSFLDSLPKLGSSESSNRKEEIEDEIQFDFLSFDDFDFENIKDEDEII